MVFHLPLRYAQLPKHIDTAPYPAPPGTITSTSDSSSHYPFEYDFAIEERWCWKEEHDPEDKYDVDPGAYEYEDDYVEAIEKWKKAYI